MRLPQLIEDMKTFTKLFQQDWLRSKKPNGLEVINIRLGGATTQLEWQAGYLQDYLDGNVEKIPMLEEDVIVDGKSQWKSKVFTPSTIVP